MDTAALCCCCSALVDFCVKCKLDCRTDWVCFDEYQKIVYGFRIFNENRVDMVKFNVFSSTKEKVIRHLRFYYSESVIVDSDFHFKSNNRCDLIGFVNLVREGFLENGKECCMIFRQLSLDSGSCKNFYVERSNKIGSFGAFFHSGTGWIVRFNSPATYFSLNNQIVTYYSLLLNDKTNEGRLEYLTSFNFNNPRCRLCDLDLEISENGQLLLIFPSSLYVYDFGTDNWTSRNNNQLPLNKIIGTDMRSLYAGLLETGSLYRYDKSSSLWFHTERKIDMSKFIKGFSSSELLFVVSRLKTVEGTNEINFNEEADVHDDDDDDDDDDDEDGIVDLIENGASCKFYDVNVLSLRDLCIYRLSNSFPSFFDSNRDRKICDILNLPKNLIRQYFGPDWALTDEVGRFIHCVSLWNNSDEENDSEENSDNDEVLLSD